MNIPSDISNLLYAAVEAAADGIVITNQDGVILWVNEAAKRLTGYSQEELIGENPRVLKSNRMDQSVYSDLWITILGGKIWRGELINKRKDGTFYYEEMTITPVYAKSGKVTNFIAVKHDISKRKQTENELQASEERYRTIFEVSPELIMLISKSGIVLDVNKRVTDWLGYEIHEIKGIHVTQLPYLTLASKLKAGAMFAARIAGKSIESYPLEVLHKNGNKRVGLIQGELIRDLQGKIVADLVLGSDITDRIASEQSLKQRSTELEKLNMLMVGRELKMIELKNELEILKKKLETR